MLPSVHWLAGAHGSGCLWTPFTPLHLQLLYSYPTSTSVLFSTPSPLPEQQHLVLPSSLVSRSHEMKEAGCSWVSPSPGPLDCYEELPPFAGLSVSCQLVVDRFHHLWGIKAGSFIALKSEAGLFHSTSGLPQRIASQEKHGGPPWDWGHHRMLK